MIESTTIPIYRITLPITGANAVLNVCGDFHYGVRGVESCEIESSLNQVTEKNKGNIFRIFTGDIIENALKTSIGHNYDLAVGDPATQKSHMIDLLKNTTKKLYGDSVWKKLEINSNVSELKYNDIRAIGVEGNHEYRSRKQSGQWVGKEMYEAAKIISAGMNAIIELTIKNVKLKMQKTYKIYVAHRPSSTSATSYESILRAFRKKQCSFPGVDILVFGHFHRRFIQADGYFDSETNKFKKILYIINPSPMSDAEYAEEAGYPPLAIGHYINCYLPLDSDPWGIV